MGGKRVKEPINIGTNESSEDWKQRFAKFMVIWSVFSHTGQVLQAYKIYNTKKAGGISLEAWIITALNYTLWLFYALFILDFNIVIFLSSTIGLILTSITLAGIMVYE